MATVTIASGVHVGTRTPGERMHKGWFGGSPTSQFSTFTLSSTNAIKTGPQAIVGHASLTDAPVEFVIERRARDVLTDSLAAIAVKGLMNGRPSRGVSDWRDALAQAGRLAKVDWSERDNAGGTNSHTVWGVIQVVDASVRGSTESLRLYVWAADALAIVGTSTWYVTPAGYAALPAAA